MRLPVTTAETEEEKQSREENKERYQKYKQLYENLKIKLDTIKERRLAYDYRKKEEKRKQAANETSSAKKCRCAGHLITANRLAEFFDSTTTNDIVR